MCTACACCNQSNDLLAAPCLQIMYSEGDKPVSLSEQLVRLGLGKVSLGVAEPAHALHRYVPTYYFTLQYSRLASLQPKQ